MCAQLLLNGRSGHEFRAKKFDFHEKTGCSEKLTGNEHRKCMALEGEVLGPKIQFLEVEGRTEVQNCARACL
jgi:hypothetical protein